MADHILYAPTNRCDVAAAEDFVYSTDLTSTTASLQATLPGGAASVQNQLVAYGDPSVGTIPVVTAPAPFVSSP